MKVTCVAVKCSAVFCPRVNPEEKRMLSDTLAKGQGRYAIGEKLVLYACERKWDWSS